MSELVWLDEPKIELLDISVISDPIDPNCRISLSDFRVERTFEFEDPEMLSA